MKIPPAALLRVGLASVFLWFGVNQLLFPEHFQGYVPLWAAAHSTSLLIVNGTVEVILGVMLIIGIWTKMSALLLALHLVDIIFSIGYNDIAVRDFGLAVATFTVFLQGPDSWCWRQG